MADVSIKVDDKSLRQVLKRFDKYPKSVQQGMTKEIYRSSIRIESKARTKAPVKTGRLRASILFTPLSNKSAKVATNVEYAADVELGHPARTVIVPEHTRVTKKGTVTKVRAHNRRQKARAARPFLAPAARAEFPKLVERLKRLLKTS